MKDCRLVVRKLHDVEWFGKRIIVQLSQQTASYRETLMVRRESCEVLVVGAGEEESVRRVCGTGFGTVVSVVVEEGRAR